MRTIETHDSIGGAYVADIPGGIFGERLNRDRRYWMAWVRVDRHTPGDCLPGMMDDFGALVPVPPPHSLPQH